MNDWLLAPFCLAVLIAIALLLRKKYTKNKPEVKKYFLPALILRLIGCFLFSLLYMYYYGGGDTFAYHWGAIAIWDAFWYDPSLWFEIMTNDAGDFSYESFNFFRDSIINSYVLGSETMLVIKTAGFLNLFTFQSYLCNAFILSFLSFIACWKIFEVFYELYPSLHKFLAYGILFVPSMFFWGAAGIMKDTLVLIGLGFGFWGCFQLLIKGKNKFKSVIYIFFGFYLMVFIKAYVAVALIPSIFIWVVLIHSNKIKRKRFRLFFKPFLFGAALVGAVLIFQSLGDSTKRFSMDYILIYAAGHQSYLKKQTEKAGGTGYDLGSYEPTLQGLLPMIPKSINVTLFRPYIWEVRKPVLLPSVLEAFLSLILTIFVILRTGFFRTIKVIFSDSTLIFCLTFSLLFSFAVGFTTYNFGSLARYKIPALPFYFAALAILYGKFLERSQAKIKARKMVKLKALQAD